MYYTSNPAVLESDDLGELRDLRLSQEPDGTQLVTMTFTVNGKRYPAGERPQHVALTNGVSHRLLPVPPETLPTPAPAQETAPVDASAAESTSSASAPATEIVTPEISDDAAGAAS